MVINIPVLEGKVFSMDWTCSTMDSIINIVIFLYGTKCTVDLFLYLSVLIFLSDVCLCSLSSVYGTRSSSIAFNSLSTWYSFPWKPLLVCRVTMACILFSISILPWPCHHLIVLQFTFPVILVKHGWPLMKQKSICSGISGWCFRIYFWMGMRYLNSICLGLFLTISPFKMQVAVP